MCNDLVHDDRDEISSECRRGCSSEKVSKREIKSKGSNPEIVKINEVRVFLKSDVDKVKEKKGELGTGTSHFES